MAFKLGTTVDLRMAYIMLMLVSMILTLMQVIGVRQRQKISVELSRQLSMQPTFFFRDLDFEHV